MSRDTAATERNFLGCLLRSPHEFWQINDLVTASMFTVAHFGLIFAAIRDLGEASRKVTLAALQAVLPEEFENDVGPAIAQLHVLLAHAEDAGSATDYAGAIAERYAVTRIQALSEWMRKEVGKRSAEDIAAEAAQRLQDIMATATPLRPVKLSEITKRVVTFSSSASKGEAMPGFTTGLACLDEITGLLMGGDFIGILGALGDGKSALLAQIGKHISRAAPVLNCNNEMSEEQNGTRFVAGESGMSVREIREGAYDFSGAEAVKDAQGRLELLHYHVYTDPRMTVRGIAARARQMKANGGLGCITIDGLKRIRTETRHRDKWEQMAEITGELKALAIELKVPILLAVQRTRTARRRDDPIPQLDDADAPTLETDADMVLGVFREESWLMMNKPNAKAGGEAHDEWEAKIRRARGIGKIIGLKVRSGKPFETREFKWNGPATRFEDL